MRPPCLLLSAPRVCRCVGTGVGVNALSYLTGTGLTPVRRRDFEYSFLPYVHLRADEHNFHGHMQQMGVGL